MQVKYIPLFRQAFNKMLSCGDNFYSQQQLKDIVNKIRQLCCIVAENPHIGSKEPLLSNVNSDYRSIVATKQIKLIYIIVNDTIYFTDIWDIRQSPTKLVNRIENL